jgi:Raf kinase inhibitor-like YbhB/YbcL family protein
MFILVSLTGWAQRQGETSMKITSPAFKEGDMIPSKYTCDGDDISPSLQWTELPKNTQSLALISDDPDAPMGTWVHWVIYNIPPSITGLPEGLPATEKLMNGERQGMTNFGRVGYGGPCPPGGTHRYYFKFYALDKGLDLKPGATKSQLLKAMEGHILAEAELMGRYTRKK